jgi:hypothetical protein
MVKAIVLYTNGKYEELNLQGYKDFQKCVGGNFESLPMRSRGYINPDKYGSERKQKLLCFANETGMLENLDSNPWAGLLMALGTLVHSPYIVYGNVVVLAENMKSGGEKNVDPYVVNLVKKFKETEDEDSFYMELEELNKVVKKQKPSKPEQEQLNTVKRKLEYGTIDVFSEKRQKVKDNK